MCKFHWKKFNNMTFQAYSTQVISIHLLVNFPKLQRNYLQQFQSLVDIWWKAFSFFQKKCPENKGGHFYKIMQM